MYADNGAYFALALVLTVLLGLLTWLAARSRGLPALVTGVGITLLPIALWLTSTLRLLADIVDDVGNWATGLVFSPRVWVGLIVAAVAVVLIGAGTALRRRTGPPEGSRKAARAARDAESLPASGRAAAEPSRSRKPATTAKTAKPGGDPELDDIEALLRKHGIS